MTPHQIALVRDSFALVAPIAEEAADLFYRRLFATDPSLAQLFASTDMDRQRKVLIQTLAVVVKGLDRLEQVVPGVEALGRRHVGYGVRPEDYATVGSALLWTLEHGLGDAYTPAVAEAWTIAFGILASTMVAAGHAMSDAVPGATVEKAA